MFNQFEVQCLTDLKDSIQSIWRAVSNQFEGQCPINLKGCVLSNWRTVFSGIDGQCPIKNVSNQIDRQCKIKLKDSVRSYCNVQWNHMGHCPFLQSLFLISSTYLLLIHSMTCIITFTLIITTKSFREFLFCCNVYVDFLFCMVSSKINDCCTFNSDLWMMFWLDVLPCLA